MSASNTPLQLKTINDYGAVSTDGSNAPDSLRNDKQDWNDILGTGKPADNATVGALPSEIAALSRGALGALSSGGYGDIVFYKNLEGDGTTVVPGEIGVSGSVFYHPDGTKRILNPDGESKPQYFQSKIDTPFEGSAGGGPTGVFYVIYSDQNVNDRFGISIGTSIGNTTFIIATYDVVSDVWTYHKNTGNSYGNGAQEFTPVDTDCIVAVGYRDPVTGTQIDSLSTLIGVNTNLPEDGADVTATSAAFTGLDSRVTVNEGDIAIHASQLTFLESTLGNGNIDTDPNHRWGFDTDLEGWISNSDDVMSWEAGKMKVEAVNGMGIKRLDIDIDGSKYDKIYVHATLVSNQYTTWTGKVFTLNSSRSGWSESYKATIPDPEFKIGDSKILVFDMTQISDWATDTTTDIRLDLSGNNDSVWLISWIAVAREGFAASSVAVDEMYTDVYDNASGLTALAGKITQLRADLGNSEGAGNISGGSVYEQVTTLETEVTDTGNASSHASRIGNMEASLDDGAGNLLAANVLSGIIAEVNNGTTGLSATVGRVDSMEAVLEDGSGNLLSANALNDLKLEVEDSETGLSATASRVDALTVAMTNAQGDMKNPIASMGAMSPRICDRDGTVTFGVYEDETEINLNGFPLAPLLLVDRRHTTPDGISTNKDQGSGRKYTFNSDVAGTVQVHLYLNDAESNIHVAMNGTDFGNPSGPDSVTQWYSYEVPVVAGSNEIEFYNPIAATDDGGEVHAIIVSRGTGDKEDMLELGTDIFMAGDVGEYAATIGDVFESTKPISLLFKAGYPVPPMCLAGYNFVHRTTRSAPIFLKITSPFRNAQVDYKTDDVSWGSVDGSVTILAGQTVEIEVSASVGIHRVRSTAPILVSARATDNTDNILVFPSSSEILSADTMTVDRFDNRGTNTSQFSGTGYYYSNDGALLSGVRVGDGNGNDGYSSAPITALGNTYFLPHPVGDFRISAIEPTRIRAYKSDGTIYGVWDFSDASRSNVRSYSEGDTTGGNTGSVDDKYMYFVGDGPFFLSTNDVGNDEYTAIGYNSNLRTELGITSSSLKKQIVTGVDSGVLKLTEALVGSDGASIKDVTQKYANYGSIEAFVENQAVASVKEDGSAKAHGLIRSNANGVITGIGFSSDSTTGASEVLIQADKFAIVGSDHQGEGYVIPDDVPFIHRSTSTTLNGETIPAGTYIKQAYIATAEIMDLLVGKLKADHISSLTLSSDIIAAGSEFTVGSGNNIVKIDGNNGSWRLWAGHATASSAPFRVATDGSVVMNNAVVTGTINGTAGTFAGFVNASTVTSDLINVNQTLTTPNRTDYRVTINGTDNTDPFSVYNVSTNEVVLGVNSSGKASFSGSLSAGVINDLAMFSQEVLDYIAPPVAGTTGGTDAAVTPMGHTNNTYIETLIISQANANPATISFQFKDGDSYWDSATNRNLSAPTYQVTVQRRVNGGTWTTLSGWSAKQFTGSGWNFVDGEKGSPDFGKWGGNFSIDINETITDNTHGTTEGDSLEYRVKFNRTTGSTNSSVPIKSYRISQATAGGGQAGIASALNSPYMALEDTGQYPAMAPESLNTASETSWIRTNSTGLIPYTSGGNSSSLGTSGWPFKTIYGVTLYENGTALSSKYAASGHTHSGYATTANPNFTGLMNIDRIDCAGGQGLWITAGESDGQVNSGNTGNNEHIYMGAEGGLYLYSSPDNWGSGFAGANVAIINDASGETTLPGSLRLTKNGVGDNIYVGDDVRLGDANLANTLFISGQQSTDRGYIIFGTDKTDPQLGSVNGGALTWGGNEIYHAGNKPTAGDIGAAPAAGSTAISQIGANVMVGSHMKIFTNDGGGNQGIRFGGAEDHTLAGEDGCIWEIEAGNDAATGNFTINRSPNIAAAGDPVSFTNVLTLSGSSGDATFAANVSAFSDAKLKYNVEEIGNAIEKIMEIRGVTFNRYDFDENIRQAGVIAQEVQKVLPEVVIENLNRKTGETTLTVNYGALTSLLIEAIKAQQTQIAEMKKDIDSIKKYLNLA